MKDANQPTFVGRVKYIRFILSRVFGYHFVVVVVLQLKSAHKLLFMSPSRPALGMANEAKDVSPRGTACNSASKCTTLLCAERRQKLFMAK